LDDEPGNQVGLGFEAKLDRLLDPVVKNAEKSHSKSFAVTAGPLSAAVRRTLRAAPE
jgi:hypothetical protein